MELVRRDARTVDLGFLPNPRAGAEVNEDDAVEALLAAHADMARLTVEPLMHESGGAPRRSACRAGARNLVRSPRDWV